MRDGKPSIRLHRIDDDLRRVIEESPDGFATAYGASLGENSTLAREVVAQTLALLKKAPRAPEWGGYLVADQNDAVVVGTCGFTHGPESDGTAEIAYFTFPRFERRGYATAMARELLDRALKVQGVQDVVAHTLPVRNASTHVLERIGLHLVGEAHDPEVGKVWLWAYRRPSASS